MDFRVLGPLEIWDGGQMLPLGGPKQRALLADLILHRGEVVSTDRLIDDLWGETPPTTALGTVRNHVVALRKVLGEEERLRTRPPGYVLDIEEVELDGARFERLVRESRGASAVEAAATLRDALGLWRGPAFADVAFERFAQGEIGRLEELRRTTIEDRVDADLALGHHADLVGELEALVAECPLRERLRSHLMLALYRCGRQAESLRAYQEFRRLLGEEMGIEPSPALQHLEERILLQKVDLDWVEAPPSLDRDDLPDGTVTFLLTDIQGSTRMWEHDPEAMSETLAHHDRLVAGAVERHGGTLIKTRGEGDSTFSVFRRAGDSLAAVVDAQLALSSVVPVRMAVHTGEAVRRGGDYFGPVVNRAARLREVAHGGQVLVSQATASLVRETLAPEVTLRGLGRHSLRDLAEPEEVFQVCHSDLGDDFPALRSLDTLPSNLPVQVTSFVGRERELEEVGRLLAETRLLTVVGAGGSGKTRLVLQLGAGMLDRYRDGVWLVELARVSDGAAVGDATARSLGLREVDSMRPALDRLVDHLRAREVLLVLDNCEHLLLPCAELAAAVLGSCPDVAIVATSQERLGIGGETVWRLATMATADPRLTVSANEATAFEAVRLFCERAASADPSFSLSDDNAAAVAEVCHRLDGIPLAIELAASRVAVLSPAEIASRLDDRFRLLTAGSRTALPRQQTLRAAMDWSYQLLADDERALLDQLSVFSGGFDLSAAEEVTSADPSARSDVLSLIARLVDRSLVVVNSRADRTRYRLLETVRQYAGDHAGDVPALRHRHMAFFFDLLKRAEPGLQGPDQRRWYEQLDIEEANIRQALAWAEEEEPDEALILARALWAFWRARSDPSELRSRLERLLAHPRASSPLARARALWLAGFIADRGDDLGAARTMLDEALTLARDAQDDWTIAYALICLGDVSLRQADYSGARQRAAEGLTFLERAIPTRVDSLLFYLGDATLFDGDADEAQDLYRRCAEACRLLGDVHVSASPLIGLGGLALARGDISTARSLLQTATDAAQEVGCAFCIPNVLIFQAETARRAGDLSAAAMFERALGLTVQQRWHRMTVSALEGLAMVAEEQRRDRHAVILFAAADSVRVRINFARPPVAGGSHTSALFDQAMLADLEARLRRGLGEPDFAAAWAEGHAMSLEHVLAAAGDHEHPASAP